jgi:hypothetical protein
VEPTPGVGLGRPVKRPCSSRTLSCLVVLAITGTHQSFPIRDA